MKEEKEVISEGYNDGEYEDEGDLQSLSNRHHQDIDGNNPNKIQNPSIANHDSIRAPPTQAKFNRLIHLDMIHQPSATLNAEPGNEAD